MDKSSSYSFRGPRFNPQYPCGRQLITDYVTPCLWDRTPFLVSKITRQACDTQTYMQKKNTHPHITGILERLHSDVCLQVHVFSLYLGSIIGILGAFIGHQRTYTDTSDLGQLRHAQSLVCGLKKWISAGCGGAHLLSQYLGRQRQEDLRVQSQPGLHSELQGSQTTQ